jgi:flavorubredoxin
MAKMKVLIVYDSVSASKITMNVAQTTYEILKEKGIEADLFYFKDVDVTAIKYYDCLIVGAPTMAFRPSQGITQFLDSLPGEELRGKRAAAFDTQIQMLASGNAAKGIQKRLEDLGLSIFRPPLVVYVERKEEKTWEFKTGEQEKVKGWALETATALLG